MFATKRSRVNKSQNCKQTENYTVKPDVQSAIEAINMNIRVFIIWECGKKSIKIPNTSGWKPDANNVNRTR
jgi:hypothetical protein